MMNGNGQAKSMEPVERVVDLFVHMPIGFAVMAWKRVPELVVSVPGLVNDALSKSCAQIAQAEERLSEEVRKARMIGQVAVTFGGRQLRREVDARLRDARQTAGGLAGFRPGSGGAGDSGAGAPGPVSAASNGAATATAESVTVTATPAAPASPPAAPPAADVPAKRPAASRRGARNTARDGTATAAARPTRPAAKKTAKGAKASGPAKASGAAKASRAAKGSGAAKASRAAEATGASAAAPPPATADDLPIREYDGLSASQVVSRLTGLTPDELRAVRVYEGASRGRRTVLLAIDRLVAGPGEGGTAP